MVQTSLRLTRKHSTHVRFFHLPLIRTNLFFSRYPICQSIPSSITSVTYEIGRTLDSIAVPLSEQEMVSPLERSVSWTTAPDTTA
jgi:hypothetical protein